MPVYNAPLLAIDAQETRRYAGLMKATNFDESKIEAACQDARLLAAPKGIWQVYDYDCEKQEIAAAPACLLQGDKIGAHLAGCEKVIALAATVGKAIEETVTKRFEEGQYAASVLLDAAATAAVEQVADAMEKAIRPKAAAKGYGMRWRFSPGYGDWPIEQQPELIRLTDATTIGIELSSSMMLIPRKSITAIIGLYKEDKSTPEAATIHKKGCAVCPKTDCPSRNV
ncbi:vitamin B12 dependent-methionine synthase activation domain-containing protein [Selenomonas sp. ND2010]|uniref:vitamin B12 dependent-methionine synthase activation domain-containing protein n=1 Tax=Selenomonas sp. ND2010 TaxID=1410618 RepID=UPI00051C7064|nr:vitamin B12 dependent-methionine synthase activation domain-containing protein [Selenomonas sp. ND2010]